MIRVDIKPELLTWARERAGLETEALAHRFPKLERWERGTVTPTLKQVEDFAKATHTPISFLRLQVPPVEEIPIPDFRTIRNKGISHPSPDLLDMIYVCQQRQEWYRDFGAIRASIAAPARWISELESQRRNPEADVGALEQEIDQLVYALCSLTPEEIQIVEGSVNR